VHGPSSGGSKRQERKLPPETRRIQLVTSLRAQCLKLTETATGEEYTDDAGCQLHTPNDHAGHIAISPLRRSDAFHNKMLLIKGCVTCCMCVLQDLSVTKLQHCCVPNSSMIRGVVELCKDLQISNGTV